MFSADEHEHIFHTAMKQHLAALFGVQPHEVLPIPGLVPPTWAEQLTDLDRRLLQTWHIKAE